MSYPSVFAQTMAGITHRQNRKYCELDSACEMLLGQAMSESGLAVRDHDKICKLARTIADIADEQNIRAEHIAEASAIAN